MNLICSWQRCGRASTAARRRRANPAYKSAGSRASAVFAVRSMRLRAGGADEAEISAAFKRITAIEKDRRTMPSVDPMDPNFRRLRYCRYADDFLIGVIGSKAEARADMASVQDFPGRRLRISTCRRRRAGSAMRRRDRASLDTTSAPLLPARATDHGRAAAVGRQLHAGAAPAADRKRAACPFRGIV